MKSKGNYINGKWIKASGEEFKSYSPVNDTLLWEGNLSNEEDLKQAIQSAKVAFELWREKENRVDYLYNFVEMLKEQKEDLAKSISYEVGKPFWESITEVNAMIGKLNTSIEAYKLRNSTLIKEQADGMISITKFKPHGVVAVIGPYNFPGHMPNSHIIPALIAGNTIVLKPSEKVPYSTEKVIDLWDKAGLPKGVINLVQGEGEIAQKLVQQEEIKAVFFTGSKEVGQKIEQECINKKLCALEMGGNSPLIVWDSSKLASAVLTTIQSAFITSGQRCSSARRLIIPNNEFGENFLKQLAKATKNVKVANIEEQEEPYMGPTKEANIVDNIIKNQEELIKKGAKEIVSSKRIPSLGKAYITPGIIDVTNVKEIEDKEIIGPFLQVIKVNHFSEAIEVANNTSYGLAAGIITEDRKLYEEFEKKIQAGIVNWNQQLTGASGYAPFGGLKNSGNYRPSGFLSTDYCVYTVASLEKEKLSDITNLPKGINL